MTIGDKIKLHRTALGLTQTELGAKLGVQKNAVSKWECGRVDDIPIPKLKTMATLFGVSNSYLMDDDKESPTPGGAELTPTQQEAWEFIQQMDDEALERFIAAAKALMG